MSKLTPVVLATMLGPALIGCGIEQAYVLRAPLEVRLGDGPGQAVTLPAGTRVRRTFFKEDVAWVEVYGTTSRGRLSRAGDPR